MYGKEKADPEFTAESRWEIRHHNSDDVNHGYFFGSDYKESSILSDFGWNIPAESVRDCGSSFVDFRQIEPDLARCHTDKYVSTDSLAPRDISRGSTEQMMVEEKVEAAASAPPSNQLISSGSSDDLPEKSTESGISSASAVAATATANRSSPSDTASKAKKKGQKGIRQPRFAFVTKSEVDHLEDGYRWRKYGQKAVKNSPFPRSYYRCTNSKCMVKKRIERSSEDPSVVITTYEGQHCHLSVVYPRGGGGRGGNGGGGLITQAVAFPRYLTSFNSQSNHPRFQRTPQGNSLSVGPLPPHVQGGGGGGESETAVEEASSQPVVGEGLLGDIVPPRMRNG